MEEGQNLNWETPPQDQNLNWETPPQDQNLNWEIPNNEKSETNINWDEPNFYSEENPQNVSPINNPDLQPIEELNPNKESNTIENQTPFSYLGKVNKIQLSSYLYQFNINNSQAVQDLQELNLQEIGDDCKFDFNPKPNTNLGKIIENIVKISAKKQLRIKECFLYKVPKNQSVLNISNTKSKETFIYYLQSNNKGGNVILNLSSIGGPTIPFINSSQGILNIIPGWIPYNISKNTSNEDIIFIAGTLD